MTEALVTANLLYLTCGIATFAWMTYVDPMDLRESWAHRTVTAIVAVLSWPLILWCLIEDKFGE